MGVFYQVIIMDYTKFLSIIQNILPATKDILPTSRLSGDLGLCSFDMMMLLFQLERVCGCQVDVSSVKQDITVNELFELISKKGGV